MSSTTASTSRRNRVVAAVIAAVGVIAVVGVLLASGGGGSQAPIDTLPVPGGPTARTGPPVPDTEFAKFDGSAATLADYSGRPLVVNFWASWCPSCVAEMSAAFRPVQERLGDQVAFLGMNIQDDRSLALDLVAETGVLFDLAEDPNGDLYVELGGLGMPFTVFISPSGEVLEEHNGPLSESQLEDMIQEILLTA